MNYYLQAQLLAKISNILYSITFFHSIFSSLKHKINKLG